MPILGYFWQFGLASPPIYSNSHPKWPTLGGFFSVRYSKGQEECAVTNTKRRHDRKLVVENFKLYFSFTLTWRFVVEWGTSNLLFHAFES